MKGMWANDIVVGECDNDAFYEALTLRGRMGAPFSQICTFSPLARAYFIQMGQLFHNLTALTCELVGTESLPMSLARCGISACEAS